MGRPKWQKLGIERRPPGRPPGSGNPIGGVKAAEKRRKKNIASVRCTIDARIEIMSYAEAFSKYHPLGQVVSQPMIIEIILERYRKDIRKWLGMDDRLKLEDFGIGGKS